MAGYIEWSKGLAKKREVIFLAATFRRDRREIAGRLMEWWEWCDDNIPEENIDKETGDAVIVLSPNKSDTEKFIDGIVEIQGLAKMLASREISWIQHLKNGKLLLRNFCRNNGSTAKSRIRNAINQAKKRKRDVTDESPDNGDKTGDKKVTTQPNPTQPKEMVGRSVGDSLEGDARGRVIPDDWEIKVSAARGVRTSHLGHATALCGFHRFAHREHPNVFPATEAGLLRILAAAVHAQRFGKKNKSGMFAWLVSNPTRAKLEGDDYEQAENRLRLHRAAIRQDRAKFAPEMIPLCDEEPAHA